MLGPAGISATALPREVRCVATANAVGDALYTTLQTLCAAGILEQNDDGFRWNPAFK